MDGKTLVTFLLFLRGKPAKIEWNEGHEISYEVELEDIPNAALKALIRAVNGECKFRPEPAELRELWRRMNGESQRVDKIIAEIREGIGRFGANAAPHPAYPDRYPIICAPGPPPGLSAPAARVVAALGGWVAMAEDTGDRSVFMGHLRRMAESVVGAASDDRLAAIGTAYKQNRRRIEAQAAARLPAATPGEDCDDSDQGEPDTWPGAHEETAMPAFGQIARKTMQKTAAAGRRGER